jgi:tetratricopeptide (TPR) repeat protein
MRRANRHNEQGDPAAAADAMLEALSAGEDPLVLYNLACYESLAGRVDDALAHLRRAVELEPSYRDLVVQDPDFEPIRPRLAAALDQRGT